MATSAGQGKINWPFSIAASIGLHAVLIGGALACGGYLSRTVGDSSKPAHEDANQPAPGPEAVMELPEPESPAGQSGQPVAVAPQSAAQPLPQPDASATASSRERSHTPTVDASRTVTYTVKAGDNLTKIAKRYGCLAGEIAALNGFQSGRMLSIGEKIKVPEPIQSENQGETR